MNPDTPSSSSPAPSAARGADPAGAARALQQGQQLRQRGDWAGALQAYAQAIALDRAFWPVWFERGQLKLDTGDVAGALQDLRGALDLAPEQAQVWLIFGNACNADGHGERALTCFQRAIQIDPAYAQAHYNAGVIHYHRDALAAAVASYTLAIAYAPNFALAHANLGVAQEAQGNTDAAIKHYDDAIAADPNDASAYWNKALLLLRHGDYPQGWRLYEWRWAAGKAGPLRRYPGRPLWLGGRSIRGKTILLHAEQGMGDTLQMARYVAQVEAAGAQVVLEVFAPLKTLFAAQSGRRQVVSTGEPLPAFDVHCPLMSLPLALGTTRETLAQNSTPYIVPDPERVAAWRDRLGPSDRLRVGFTWKGNPQYPGNAARSIPLERITGLFSERAQFICLQKDLSPAERARLSAFEQVLVLGDELGDFSGTSALMACCDVVVSVDTATAHLAGAMGMPTWVLLAARSDWRWLQDRGDSPWYPSARLFRQARHGVWDDVVAAVRAALADVVAGKGGKP